VCTKVKRLFVFFFTQAVLILMANAAVSLFSFGFKKNKKTHFKPQISSFLCVDSGKPTQFIDSVISW
jgi:hypothetical protein